MAVLVTRKAPDFIANAILADGEIDDGFSLSAFRGKYVVLFFYQKDFTFVCPSEILAFNRKLEDFENRDCQLIGISIDTHFSHAAWRRTPIRNGGIGEIGFPLVGDPSKEIAEAYGVLLNGVVTTRGLFLIDKQGVVQHQSVNNLPIGRNIAEVLRMVDALQFTEVKGECCPANWEQGDDGLMPTAAATAKYLKEQDEIYKKS